MKIVRLQNGFVESGPLLASAEMPSTIDRGVMLVYTGTFQSMDGEVTITEAHLRAIADNHNRKLAITADGSPSVGGPPLQLDHSKQALHTIGRVVGPLRVDPTVVNGANVLALFGTARFLGRENVEKACDGRYLHVSIGANLEDCTLDELSITPFPAAEHATLLSKGSHMDKEKLKKKLMEKTKCSADEADKKLGEMDDDEKKKLSSEVDEDEKKLAEEDDKAKKDLAEKEDADKKALSDGDKEDDKEDKKLSRLSRAELTKFVTDAREQLRLAKIEARKGEVSVKLAGLRAKAMISPVEQAKISKLSAKLAGASDEALALVWEVLEAREPIVHIGQVGSVKVLDVSHMGERVKQARLSKLEQETIAQMPMLASAVKPAKQDPQHVKTSMEEQYQEEMARLSAQSNHEHQVSGNADQAKSVEAMNGHITRLSAVIAAFESAIA